MLARTDAAIELLKRRGFALAWPSGHDTKASSQPSITF